MFLNQNIKKNFAENTKLQYVNHKTDIVIASQFSQQIIFVGDGEEEITLI